MRTETRKRFEADLSLQLKAKYRAREAGIQYLQSLLVWNLPVGHVVGYALVIIFFSSPRALTSSICVFHQWHLLSVMILAYLAVYYVELVAGQFLVFQTVGGLMMMIAVSRVDSIFVCSGSISSSQVFPWIRHRWWHHVKPTHDEITRAGE
jgi:hypothetical protein